MNRTLATVCLAGALACQVHAQTNIPSAGNFALVTNLWYNGFKSNVLAIAEQRLAVNSNDLAGLILKMEFNLEFSNDSCLSNDINNVLEIAGTVTNATFAAKAHELREDLLSFLNFLRESYHLTPNELEQEKAKAFIIHKRMTYEDYLKWLHDDGMF